MKKKYIYSYDKICEECNGAFVTSNYNTKLCSKQCVSEKIRKQKTKYSPEQIEQVIALRSEGFILEEISQKTGINSTAIKSLLTQRKIHLTEEQKDLNTARRWKDHTPFIDGDKLKCSTCDVVKTTDFFCKNKYNLSGFTNRCKECDAIHYAENSEIVKDRVDIYRKANPEKIKESYFKYYDNNKEDYIFRANFRRAAQIQRTPSWLTPQDLQEIEDKYVLARTLTESTGIQYHVDHIVPLLGKNVSGFHCPENLQVIPAIDNLKKSNKF